MKNSPLFLRLAITGCAAALALEAACAPAVEAYVAPPSLFPLEGDYQGKPPGVIQAYNADRTSSIGEITGRQNCKEGNCDIVFELTLKGSHRRISVEVAEWNYETVGLVTYEPSIFSAGKAWSPLNTSVGKIWIQTDASDVHRFESLVSTVPNPLQWCSSPGQCSKTSQAFLNELDRVAALVTCYDNPYTVTSVVTHNRKRYYRLDLPKPLPFGVTTNLPTVGYVPVYNRDGMHTGTFFSRGC